MKTYWVEFRYGPRGSALSKWRANRLISGKRAAQKAATDLLSDSTLYETRIRESES